MSRIHSGPNTFPAMGRSDSDNLSNEPGNGGGSPAVELLRLDYRDLAPEDPLTGVTDWTIDRHFAALTKVSGASGWEAITPNGSGSMHADIAILNLNSQSVFVGMEGVSVPNVSSAVAMIVTKGHAPGVFWTSTDGFETDGYFLVISPTQVFVKGYDGSGSNYATSPDFGDAIVGGVLSKIEMRVVIGGSSNIIQVFLDDIQLGSDWEDNNANRIQGVEVFGTIGCAVSFAGGGAGIIEQVYGGTL